VASAVTLTLLVTLVPGHLYEFLCLGLQQLVKGFFYATLYQLLELSFDNLLI